MAKRRYQQDRVGQWWYITPRQRRRCKLYVCGRPGCKKTFPRTPEEAKKNGDRVFCSRSCAAQVTNLAKRVAFLGEGNPNWKGHIRHENGYVLVYAPGHPKARKLKYVPEHRLVMEEHLGRYLTEEESVHHKNSVRDDNSLKNLDLWTTDHPKGKRVSDAVEWALALLRRYAPENLATK